MRKSIFLAAILSVVIYLLIFPKEAFEASLSGLKLWFYTILPSLLPFLILSDFLIKTDKIPSALQYVENIFQKLLGLTSYGTYAFLMGVFCGYPMGAKLTGDLYREGKISQNEAFYLLSFANNASPMFVTSYVLLNSLKLSGYTIITFVILYSSVLLTSVTARIWLHRWDIEPGSKNTLISDPATKYSLIELIDTSIMSGFETIVRLGGYIILFSIGAALISRLTVFMPAVSSILTGTIEITTGIWKISQSDFPISGKYIIILTLTSFGGFSSIAQTKGVLRGTPLKISYYMICKTLNAVYTLLILILLFVIKSI